MTDSPRLIEVAFPLKQTSIDSVHEKNVRHGHISTLHIWPARRPLAACRAALIATLLPDPGNKKERDEILKRLGGTVVEKIKNEGKANETIKEETKGGILHWGRESSPDLDWFRQKIREAYGGRAPKVLDPFAGGGAIPLEAMRLGCEATAIDINPVAWFILKCTLEYPQKLAGQKRPLPSFVLKDREFMASFFKAQGYKGKSLREQLEKLGFGKDDDLQLSLIAAEAATLEADLAWHVRAWGWWVLQQAKADLERFYPVVDGKPTVAYLWARTVKCKSCRATIPLLKTRWLCKKDKKRVLLTMEPLVVGTSVPDSSDNDASTKVLTTNNQVSSRHFSAEPNSDTSTKVLTTNNSVVFGIQNDVPVVGGNSAQKKAHDQKIGAGTMSKSGAKCPCCPSIMTREDIRLEGKAGRLGAVMTAVVVDGDKGKEYRLPVAEEIQMAAEAEKELEGVFAEIPFGLPEEPTPKGGSGASRAFSVDAYGFDKWHKLFTPRQLLALGTFVKQTRLVRDVMQKNEYPSEWIEAIEAYLALANDRLADYSSAVCSWHNSGEKMRNTFGRFALPIIWDFTEVAPGSETSGGYLGAIDWIARFISHPLSFASQANQPKVIQCSSTQAVATTEFDVILTDPPYYDTIPYSDLMDFFYVWLRRTLNSLSPEIDAAFQESLAPKWNHEEKDGELIDDASRFDGDKAKSKANYEDGMYRVFQNCHKALKPEGRLVIVFAHKHPDAWETLVSAIIRAGFIVDGSWPIQTEMGNRTRALSSAALSSSVWLVCKKRPATARPGWDNRVLDEMRQNITTQLREFWDAGIRGPDFVWAATGPAMEAYSKYPVLTLPAL